MKNNWWRIIVFFLLFLLATAVWSIPLFLFYGEKILNPHLAEEDYLYSFFSQMAAACGAITTAYIMIVRIESKTFDKYSLTFKINDLAKGFSWGILIMTLFAITAFVTGIVVFHVQHISFLLFANIMLYFFVAIAEEVFFRGYMLSSLRERMGSIAPIVTSSLLFGAVHFFNDYISWIGLINISISGCLMALLTVKTKSISAAVGLHWAWNFFQGPIFGFAVSGNQEVGLVQPVGLVSEIFTGGKFGAEGSIALAFISVLILFIFYKRYNKYEYE